MNAIVYPYKMNRFFLLMAICFFCYLTDFSFTQANNVEQWLVVGKSATLSLEQTRYLLLATAIIFSLLASLALYILFNTFKPIQNIIFTSDAISYPKGHIKPSIITILYNDIRQLKRINQSHNEALEITTADGKKYRLLRSLVKNQAVFEEICQQLEKKITLTKATET